MSAGRNKNSRSGVRKAQQKRAKVAWHVNRLAQRKRRRAKKAATPK